MKSKRPQNDNTVLGACLSPNLRGNLLVLRGCFLGGLWHGFNFTFNENHF